MVRNACVPDVRHTKLANPLKRRIVEIGELANAVFLDRAPRFVGAVLVAEKPCENLVNDRFTIRLLRVDFQFGCRMVPVNTHSQCLGLSIVIDTD